MANEVKVILDLSYEVQTLLEQQDVDLYKELQQEEPSFRFEVQPDPDALAGSRDATMVILAVSTLVSSMTPLIIRILNQFTPPNRAGHWEVEETETHHPDGTVIVHRKRVRSSKEQYPWTSLPYPDSHPSTPSRQTSIPQHTEESQ